MTTTEATKAFRQAVDAAFEAYQQAIAPAAKVLDEAVSQATGVYLKALAIREEIEEAVRRSPPGLRAAIRRRLTPHLDRQRRLEQGVEKPTTQEEIDELFG